MISQEKSAVIPMLFSLGISAVVLVSLWLLKDTPLRQLAVTVTLIFSLCIFLAFLIYFSITSVLRIFKKSIWLAGMPSAILAYFGIMILSLSYFNETWSILEKDGWNPNIVALGIAVFALGVAFFPRQKPPLEETLNELKEYVDTLESKVAAFSEMQNNLQNTTGLVVKESQKFLKNLSEIFERTGNSKREK